MRKVRLESAQDAAKVVQRIVNRMFIDGVEVDKAGTISNLLTTFLRALEVSKLDIIEARLLALERGEVYEQVQRPTEKDEEPPEA